jgi:cytochrome c peroxidase
MFKVPSLRNVVKTAPYFHDGSVSELPKAIEMMAHHQLGKKIADEDVRSIIAFLGALTGEVPTDYIKKPELPESGRRTPKPSPN